MLVDLTASIILALRAIRQIGVAFGYDVEGDLERWFRLTILELASTSDRDVRQGWTNAIKDAVN